MPGMPATRRQRSRTARSSRHSSGPGPRWSPATAGGSPPTSGPRPVSSRSARRPSGSPTAPTSASSSSAARPDAIVPLVGQLSGGQVDPGDALLAEGAWWCAVSPAHVLALCDAGETERVRARRPRPSAGRRARPSPTSRRATRRSGCSGPARPTCSRSSALRAAARRRRVARLRRPAARRDPGDAAARRSERRGHRDRGGPRRGAVGRGRARRRRVRPRPRGRRRGVPPSPLALSEAEDRAADAERGDRPVKIHAPSERNPKLAAFLAAANGDTQLKARWLAQQTTAERLGMSDHSWVHLQIVLNMALRLFRMLRSAT